MSEKRCLGCMRVKRNTPICEHCGYDERRTNGPHQLQLGTLLQNQYYVGRVLGQGGFGITYIGWDNFLEIPVAIKEYYPNVVVTRNTTLSPAVYLRNSDGREQYMANLRRFAKEARALAKLGAEEQLINIVRVQNLVQSNNTAYIIMEYVAGVDLREHLRRKGRPMTSGETLDMLLPLMQALDKVHAHGIIHRDISPDNIMVTRDGSAKLIDFGASHLAEMDNEGNQKSTEAIVKHGFAPMEQYSRRGKLGPWTDVYAMCATVYYCLTGKVLPPVMDRAFYHDEIDWSIVHGLSSGQLQAMKDGLTLGTDERIQTMAILHSRLTVAQEPVIPAEAVIPVAEFTLEPEISVLPMEAVSETPEEIIPDATAPILAAEQPTELVAPEDMFTEVTVPILPEDLPTEVVVPEKMEEPAAEAEIYEAPEEEPETEAVTEDEPGEEIPEETPEKAEEPAPESEVPELPEEEPEEEPESPAAEEESIEEPAEEISEVPEEGPEAEPVLEEAPAEEIPQETPEEAADPVPESEVPELPEEEPEEESIEESAEAELAEEIPEEIPEEISEAPEEAPEAVPVPAAAEEPAEETPAEKEPLVEEEMPLQPEAEPICEEETPVQPVAEPAQEQKSTAKPAARHRRKRRKLWPIAVAAVFACAIGLFLFAKNPASGNRADSPTATEAPQQIWLSNILMHTYTGEVTESDPEVYRVFRSELRNDQILSVTFLDTLAQEPSDSWDVSASENGSVKAWATANGNLYDLYIAAEGGVNGAQACKRMFAEFCNLERIHFGDAFHTEGATDMTAMFFDCKNLTELDLSGFDISGTDHMDSMFEGCRLKEVNHSALNKLLPYYDPNGWRNNVLMRTHETDIQDDWSRYETAPVFGSDIPANAIRSVTFLDNLEGEPEDSWDVSMTHNGSVKAWADKDGHLYDLYIAARGGINVSQTCRLMFAGFCNLERIHFGDAFYTENTKDMTAMFFDCKKLTELDLSQFDTRAVTCMHAMFQDCRSLTSLDLSSFNTAKVIHMSQMFFNCAALTDLNVSSFDISRTAGMDHIFQGCRLKDVNHSALNKLLPSYDPNGWRNNVLMRTHGIGDIQEEWIRYETAPVFGSDIPANAIRSVTFLDTLGEEPEDSWDVSMAKNGSVKAWVKKNGHLYDLYIAARGGINGAQASRRMFAGFCNLEQIHFGEAFHTEGATDMTAMFYDCKKLTSLDLSHFDTRAVTSMFGMFESCASLTGLDLRSFDTSRVFDMGYMFMTHNSKLTSLDLSSFNTANVTDMRAMFWGLRNLESLDVSGFNTARVMDMNEMFKFCQSLKNLDVSGFNTTRVTNMDSMFSGCSSLAKLDVSGFNTANVKDMGFMFSECRALTSLDCSSFDTSRVTDITCMFSECIALTALDCSSFTTRQITTMDRVFAGCRSLKRLDVSSFDTSNVLYMGALFSRCESLTELDLSHFDLSHSPTTVGMFYECTLKDVHHPELNKLLSE